MKGNHRASITYDRKRYIFAPAAIGRGVLELWPDARALTWIFERTITVSYTLMY